ncbi:MAG: hypothetical protein HAW67_06150 [Endozoicomonadaceae bacterium]|nr:hypothetical protein [Endozoicomonadaceae bacterium]
MVILSSDVSKTEYFKEIHTSVSAVKGMQNRGGDYGSISSPEPSEGHIKVLCDHDVSTETFVSTVNWIKKHGEEIIEASLKSLLPEYSELRPLVLESLVSEDSNLILPNVNEYMALKSICGVIAIYVNNKTDAGEFSIGIEFGCNWDEEHGAGCLFEGLNVVDVGGADVAF